MKTITSLAFRQIKQEEQEVTTQNRSAALLEIEKALAGYVPGIDYQAKAVELLDAFPLNLVMETLKGLSQDGGTNLGPKHKPVADMLQYDDLVAEAQNIKAKRGGFAMGSPGERYTYYFGQVEGLDAVEKTPDDMARILVETEQKSGAETADILLKAWKGEQSAAEGAVHPYMVEVRTYMREHKTSEADAHKVIMASRPHLYQAYSKAIKTGLFVQVGSAEKKQHDMGAFGDAVEEYRKENSEATEVEAFRAVMREKPQLYTQYNDGIKQIGGRQ